MQPSKKCYDLVKSFESFEAKAYKDPGSENGLPITIGYGSTRYLNGRDIRLGDVITHEDALILLDHEIQDTGKSVLNIVNSYGLTQSMFDAVVSFTYNVGIKAFRTSTMRRLMAVNPLDPGIEAQFLRWIYNDGKKMPGLVRRRKSEAALYYSK